MNFIKNLFGKKEEAPLSSYQDFWTWFQRHEKSFFQAVKKGDNIDETFFQQLAPKLAELKDGFYFLTGMYDDHTAELVITPDGALANIVFAEELINAAPALPHWKFTALKPELDIRHVAINMGGYTFDRDNLSFYAIEHPNYPDEVDIVLVHNDYREDNQSDIINGSYIFLDNYLGELNAITTIDNLTVISRKEAKADLIPIDKLKAYLLWREKEFIEKYNGTRHDTENDEYSTFEATLENGRLLLAIINTTLLDWDSKASHPWMLRVEINYDGESAHGMPEEETYALLNTVEEEITATLKDHEGYLNVGRQTADGIREIYFACKDFRLPSKVLYALQQKYRAQLDLNYHIFKDKYWQSFERFSRN